MTYEDINQVPKATLFESAQGCLLGGAIGDALGAPVEFMSLEEIRNEYGPDGIQEFDKAYGVLGAITDDTQMTLFSAEGLIRARLRSHEKGICSPETVVAYAYQRWLKTQREPCHPRTNTEGWLLANKGLHFRRAPGMTCLSALRIWDHMDAKNNSKGCGTIMRSAPFAFVPNAAELAWNCAKITHGHPEASASSAILAGGVQFLVLGHSIEAAIEKACEPYDSSESARLSILALELARSNVPSEAAITQLGQGWTADEALAIGAYCAVKSAGDFESGVRMAVNHDGDSDSTGSICGNLLGTIVGYEGLPKCWRESVELADVIVQIAMDLVGEVPTDSRTLEDYYRNYPAC